MRIEKLSDAKNKLSELVRAVGEGERVRIVVRGRPVADLVPVVDPASEGDLLEARLADLERRGLIRRGSARVDPRLFEPGPQPRGSTVTRALLEERDEGR